MTAWLTVYLVGVFLFAAHHVADVLAVREEFSWFHIVVAILWPSMVAFWLVVIVAVLLAAAIEEPFGRR